MRWLNAIVLAVGCGALAQACVASPTTPAPDEQAPGESTQAITSACSFDTLGLPCDPDGPAKPKLECEGVCAIAASGEASCRVVDTGTLDGVVCGTTAGIGNGACKHYCQGRACLAANAPAGAACRTAAGASPCTGQCDGAGTCDAIAKPCDFGREEQLCHFNGCDFTDATQCVAKNLPKNTLCSDADACSIGRCSSGGACQPGAVVGCDDGNSCTDDTCDPANGACLGTNNDNNTCSDGNACFTGEHCSAGKCVPGKTPVDCEDNNACTKDECDPNTGCAHIQKSCSDNDACTTDDCDPGTGACSHSDVVCNDNDPCTDDSCSTATGCVFTAKACDDADACTADSCSNGSCGHTSVDCNDNDSCTIDACAAATGCSHTPIAGCGVSGEGGAGGVTGAAGADSGGSSNTAGADDGADAGAPNAGTAGGGTAGSEAGGTGGNETGGSAVAGNTAAGGVSGSTATAGAAAGGTSSSGGNGGSGAASSGASESFAGEADVAGASGVNSSSGCGCVVVGGSGHSGAPLGSAAFALFGLAVAVRRRRVA